MFNPFTSSAATAGYTMAASPVERSSNQLSQLPAMFLTRRSTVSTTICPSCQRETAVDPSWKYCTKCGSRLTTSNPVGAATAVATRPASTSGYGTPEAVRRGAASETAAWAASASRKPGKAFIFSVALAFCFAGAVVGALVGFFAQVKGAELITAGIAAGGAAAYEYLRRRGAFPSKKRENG